MLTLYPQHDNPPAYLILTPIEHYFYIATLGDYGVYIIFYGCSLEPPHRDGPNVRVPTIFVLNRINRIFLLKKNFFNEKINHIEQTCFRK